MCQVVFREKFSGRLQSEWIASWNRVNIKLQPERTGSFFDYLPHLLKYVNVCKMFVRFKLLVCKIVDVSKFLGCRFFGVYEFLGCQF